MLDHAFSQRATSRVSTRPLWPGSSGWAQEPKYRALTSSQEQAPARARQASRPTPCFQRSARQPACQGHSKPKMLASKQRSAPLGSTMPLYALQVDVSTRVSLCLQYEVGTYWYCRSTTPASGFAGETRRFSRCHRQIWQIRARVLPMSSNAQKDRSKWVGISPQHHSLFEGFECKQGQPAQQLMSACGLACCHSS